MYNVNGLLFSFLFLFCTSVWSQGSLTSERIAQLPNEELTTLAEKGNAEAQYQLGHNLYSSREKDPAEKWLRLAAKQGNVNAMLLLSDSYYSPTSKDKHYWYETMAMQKDTQGMLFNAIQYEQEKDDRQAYVWYLLANRVLSMRFTSCKWSAPECYDLTYQGMVEKLAERLSDEDKKAAKLDADMIYQKIFNK
ncbi:Uncharacterised protein [Leminorella richardii]|uniref:Sel1 repeat n=1 Tax=Leminorella richardii TaxID=158841 RepID=A0A2X4URV1_9GAMM|nr:hypothetical protein [Leminorella richardii]SQI41583.1 Uncharacterised protein [Leminorella richardii]